MAVIDAVLLCNNTIDIFNPNVIRSSLGAVFPNNITIDNYYYFMVKKNIKNIYNIKLEKKYLAIVIGEGHNQKDYQKIGLNHLILLFRFL
ncbi:MAG: hypothetical protein ACE19O_00220 [Candidatus Karelsulcia muelleri]